MSVLLDTHFWIWWLTPQAPISATERAALDELAAKNALYLSAISLWEAQVLHAKRRLVLPIPFGAWLHEASAPNVVSVLPLDVDVVLTLETLPASFHGDPADRILVATAKAHGLSIATRDAMIRRSRFVALWKP